MFCPYCGKELEIKDYFLVNFKEDLNDDEDEPADVYHCQKCKHIFKVIDCSECQVVQELLEEDDEDDDEETETKK